MNATQNEYLVLSRGKWDKNASKEEIERAIKTFYDWIERHITAGDLEAALQALEQALEIDAISEELYRRTMEIQGQLARRDAIRGTFRLLQGHAPLTPKFAAGIVKLVLEGCQASSKEAK